DRPEEGEKERRGGREDQLPFLERFTALWRVEKLRGEDEAGGERQHVRGDEDGAADREPAGETHGRSRPAAENQAQKERGKSGGLGTNAHLADAGEQGGGEQRGPEPAGSREEISPREPDRERNAGECVTEMVKQEHRPRGDASEPKPEAEHAEEAG